MKTTTIAHAETPGNTLVNNDSPLAMEALRESEYLLRESQVIAGLGTYVLDVATGLWRSSEVMNEIFGIDTSYVRTVENWAALVHPDDRTMMHDYFLNEVIGKRLPFNKEYRILRHNDNSERWLHGWGKLEFDAQGSPAKMIGIIQDITARKRTEDALRESEAKFAKVFRNAPVWIAITNVETGVYLDINEQAQKAMGFTREQIIGHTSDELGWIKAEDRNALVKKISHESRIAGLEMAFRANDGSTLYGWVTSEIMTIDGHPALVSVGIDITDRKRAENALRQSETKFANVFRDAPVWIAITDMETGVYIDINDQALEASGFSREEFIGHTGVEIGWITPANRERLLQESKAHEKITGMELSFRTKKGRTVYGWITGEIVAINGRSALLSVTTDITDRKEADEKLSKQMDELRRWQAVTLGRESRIGELKREVNALATRLGLQPPYGTTDEIAMKENR